ncbi:hypothetical protein KR51_00019200 [Rubidibacter lacunae KORDI 51-2]|uniref:Uncharacterized protein n=1 Tax=Rubidibacter lacunae KORDI 51-2 TaxID=582515 RepID=U5D9U1_9CHRO|nr:hypothetical protein [Rubidibacter lacunae]ERN41353.1 hypothetical protein KR51_00019200 [Rubidibacter lacunae KORDI 51-2]
MPGTHNSGRPGGNPELAKYHYTTDRSEPLTENLNIKVPRSWKAVVRAEKGWPDRVRRAIAAEFELEDNPQPGAGGTGEETEEA